MRKGTVNFALLKERESALALPRTDTTLRIHRAISWGRRAEVETSDFDLRFILLWVAFNAAYGHLDETNAHEGFKNYFGRLLELDGKHRISEAVWDLFPHEVGRLLDNVFVFHELWQDIHSAAPSGQWKLRWQWACNDIDRAKQSRDTRLLLKILFGRLYVLRNQLVHGGATWSGRVNRSQVCDGAEVLAGLVPLFVELMLDHPKRIWGRPHYPVIEDPLK